MIERMLLIAMVLSAAGAAVSVISDTGWEMTAALAVLLILLAAVFLLFRRIRAATDPDEKLAAKAEAFLMPVQGPGEDEDEKEITGKLPDNQ